MRSRLVFGLVGLELIGLSFGSASARMIPSPFVPVAARGATRLSARLGSEQVSVVLITHVEAQLRRRSPSVAARRTACTGSRIPCSLLDQLIIRVGGHALAIPRSSVSDIADVNRAGLFADRRGAYVLELECGDASEAYTARIDFDAHRVRARVLIDGEAGQVSERTTYEDQSHAFDD